MKKYLLSLIGLALFLLIYFISFYSNNIEGFKLNTWYDEKGNILQVPIIKELKGKDIILKTTFQKVTMII
ncbi:hypothetical protein [Marinitoga lauensis]|uniref:hypothetical protein n=1 Tax=Marinitoga lauensis TaxID=2201189 RepID=UPI001012907B|nr:hypothetical protein [Marinitoga lauensis]